MFILFLKIIEGLNLITSHDQFQFLASISNENGLLDLEDLEKKLKQLNSKKFLLSTMLVNNENGVVQPIWIFIIG